MKNTACFSGVVPIRKGVLDHVVGMPHDVESREKLAGRRYHARMGAVAQVMRPISTATLIVSVRLVASSFAPARRKNTAGYLGLRRLKRLGVS